MEKFNAEDGNALKAKNQNLNDSQIAQVSRILLVEDHRLAEKVTKNMLIDLDCHVDSAMDGKTALELIKYQPYNLIFMDIGLPDMSGNEITRRIRAYELTKGSHLPIIALTAHTDSKTQQACLDAGMNAVLSKPIHPEEAAKILNNFIPERKNWLKHQQQQMHKEEKVFDFDYAKKLLRNNETVIWETLTLFVESLPYEVKKLEEAYQNENWIAIQAIANKLKGGSSYCGTLRLKSVCNELDNLIEASLISQAIDLYKCMLSEIESVQKFVNAHKKSSV